MKKNLLLYITLLIGGLYISASDYEPLVREDRVWEYFEYNSFRLPTDEYRQFRFSGEKEYGGKMYSRFIESRRINYNRYTKITDTVDMSVPKALMREEDKRVFMLVDKNEMLPVGEVSDKSELVEVVLYDFNVKYVYNDISSELVIIISLAGWKIA